VSSQRSPEERDKSLAIRLEVIHTYETLRRFGLEYIRGFENNSPLKVSRNASTDKAIYHDS
jgi:hypothetical protein